jgi:Chaperone of endosialidase
MKKITFLLSAIVLCSIKVSAQDTTPDRWIDNNNETNITIPSGGRINIIKTPESSYSSQDEIKRIRMFDSANDYFSIRNATGLDNRFIPWLIGYNETDARVSMFVSGITTPLNDVSSGEAVLKFDARRYNNGDFTSGGGPIQNRTLFSWGSYLSTYMLMSAEGNLGLGLGITSPQAQLHTSGTVRFAGIPTNGGTSIVMADGAGNLSRQNLPANAAIPFINTSSNDNVLQKFNSGNILVNSQITDNGSNIGIGGSPTTNGKLTIYGTLHMMSDERTKTHIVKMENALEKIDKLNGYYYEWKENGTQTEVGLLAQEVEKVLPEAVSENEKGTKFLNYDGLIPVLTEAIKEQQKLIKAQGLELEKLKKEVEALKRK